MFDYILAFADEATARADPITGQYYIQPSAMNAGQWRGDVCIAGVKSGIDANDTTAPGVDTNGEPITIVNHAYLPGFWLVISRSSRDAGIEASAALVLGASRDLANSGAPPSGFIVALGPGQSLSGFVGANIAPEFAGANYPFGAAA